MKNLSAVNYVLCSIQLVLFVLTSDASANFGKDEQHHLTCEPLKPTEVSLMLQES